MNAPFQAGGAENSAQTIARQAEEIAFLRRRLEEENAARELRRTLTVASAAGVIAAPASRGRLLELIVEAAAQAIAAEAAALFLLDEEREELIFEIVLGGGGSQLKQIRLPLGHGIAGLVALTGQPLAISDAGGDARQAADIAQTVGYTPRNILCVPMFHEERILGVLELCDKIEPPGAANGFSTNDMTTLGLFANLAAAALEGSRLSRNLTAMLSEAAPQNVAPAAAFVSALEEDAAYRGSLELAELVWQIARAGEAEVQACRTILEGFARYLQTRAGDGA